MYIFVTFVHDICENEWKLAAVESLSSTYSPTSEVITKVSLRCSGISEGVRKNSKKQKKLCISA